MRISRLFLFAIVFLSVSSAQAFFEQMEFAEEGPFYGFYLGKDLNGHVKTKACETCQEKMFIITPDVKASLDGKPVPLSRFVMSKHVPSVLHFDMGTKKLSRIVWYTKK
ncbi:MAG: hypothetical protein OEY87_06190 [Gammaproteobacteria bacterium]|nr:hypothetical protein [Gammaproteobacteria bacterium]MDH5735695.1 hypothetical protein [Gammaproteobacteria bacterium]